MHTNLQQEALEKAREENIALQEKTSRAAKQKDVIDAKLSIEIEKDKADAARRKAEGVRDSTKYEADGEAYKQRETGTGLADARGGNLFNTWIATMLADKSKGMVEKETK